MKALPLFGVIAAGYVLASYSEPAVGSGQRSPRPPLGRVEKRETYKRSASLFDPFLLSKKRTGAPRRKRLRLRPASRETLIPNLSGILWSQAAPVAFINGDLRYPGDMFNGLRLMKILPDRVVLRKGALEIIKVMRNE